MWKTVNITRGMKMRLPTLVRKQFLQFVIVLFSLISPSDGNENTHYMPALECYDPYGRPQKCLPEFINAAYQVQIEATNTCGELIEQNFCVQTGYSNRKSCELCRAGDHHPRYLTDLHDPQNPTWWQSETMYEGIQSNQVNLTLHLGKSFDITYIRIVFHSPRPESFAIYKRVAHNGPWIPYQYYSATCRTTYGLPDSLSVKKGEDESRALCTSEYSDISPLRFGNVAFSSLEGRPSAIAFENSRALQNWVTATDIKITLDRLNTFGDEVFGDPQVLKSYFYSIADIAVGARCKCNGHASKCVVSTGLHGERSLVCQCKHNTDGPDCEKCLPNYNDIEWRRATSKDVNECKPCNCNGYSEKCFFDRQLFNLTGHGGHCLDCRDNRDGPNCERCKENYYMREDGYCVHCACDPMGSRSLQCNTEGKCQCKPGVTGEKCNRCDANYYHFSPHGCQPCGCDLKGSLDNTPSCDPETGICACKENVEGKRCKECKPGFFNLDLDNKFGCTPCFCYGHTSECQSAVGYSIVSLTSHFNKHKERWLAVNNNNEILDLKYNQYSQTVGTTIGDNENIIYFAASDRFLGDQRASYNRVLKFKLQLVGQIGPNPSPSDIVLEGARTKISLPIFAQGNYMPNQEMKEYSFRLHEHPEYSWQPSQSARGFMSILSNLTAIKIRASYSSQGEAILDDFELQTAHRGAAGRAASWIEQCTCPEGYLGQFCESCAPGYRHSPSRGGPFMPCIPCDCNKHAEICDSETGRCICQHNTAGDTCDHCSRGYYGNALGGTAFDCKRCPCPNDGACLEMPDSSVICLECPIGYFGSRCEQCSDGYYGDPNGIYGVVSACKSCDCNGNVDPNAVGNCNRTSGECLKCIYNTAGVHCEYCLPGHFGDPLALPHGKCEECSCHAPGTEQIRSGISLCDQLTGNCKCKSHVTGRDCNECELGYFKLDSGNGCESCNCDQIGSYNITCDRFKGECYCKPGVTELRCDKCAKYEYGFSSVGCKPCDCDEGGSKGHQCDEFGQCPCNENVEGRQCNRCKENKYDRHKGCLNCPHCYDLVQDAVNKHRYRLQHLNQTLENITQTPVANDEEFEAKIKNVQQKVDILLADAKAGAGDEGRTLLEHLNDLRLRLEEIRKLLEDSERLQILADKEVKIAGLNASLADLTIQNARNLLTVALNLLKTDGTQALNKARDKFDQFGPQSTQISDISRQARAIADDLEAQAAYDLKSSQDANEVAFKAYDLAKSTISLQMQMEDDLQSTFRLEFARAKNELNETNLQTKSSLENANEAYDTSLALFTSVDSLMTPEISTNKLKKDATASYYQALRLKENIAILKNSHDGIFNGFVTHSELANMMEIRAQVQEEEAVVLHVKLKEAHDLAKKAVLYGDITLQNANSTYHTLAGFQSQVPNLTAKAQSALKSVSQIQNEIYDAENMINIAKNALHGADKDATQAQNNAQSAQAKYALQASKDAEVIRKKANDTKVNARKLRSEVDQLNGRVAVTDYKISYAEQILRGDEKLIEDTKKKVGEAKADSIDARNIVEKIMKEVQIILEDLNSLRDIDATELNNLEIRLNATEAELNRVNISERLEALTEIKNKQNQLINDYENEISRLQYEVENILTIADALPLGCFKRSRLEP